MMTRLTYGREMTVGPETGVHVAICDVCGDEGPPGRGTFLRLDSREHAMRLAAEAGWQLVTHGLIAGTLCPSCLAKHQEMLADEAEFVQRKAVMV